MIARSFALACVAALGACGGHRAVARAPEGDAHALQRPTLAQVYYWKARPGMLEAYNRYIIDVAEPIDAEAQRQGAFISVTTYISRDTLTPWTHMRVFLLRGSAQLAGLSAALDAAGRRLEPDSAKRRVRGEYAATLRDRVGSALLTVIP